jgi:hypothetical protein
MRVLLYARLHPGLDDNAVVRAFERRGAIVHVVDDEKYLYPRWDRGLPRLFRRAMRSQLVERINDEIVAIATEFTPDLFFAFKAPAVRTGTLERLKALGVSCVMYYPDISFSINGEAFLKTLELYDHLYSNKSFARQALAGRVHPERVHYLPLWYDPEIHRDWTGKQTNYSHDVLFVGHRTPRKLDYCTHLYRCLPGSVAFRIYGGGWQGTELAHLSMPYPVYGREIAVLYRTARVNLGLLSESPRPDTPDDLITARTVQIPASGGFLLHQKTPEFDGMFPGYRATFTDRKSLTEQVIHYLNAEHEREACRQWLYDEVCRSGRDVDTLLSDMLRTIGLA